MSAKLLAGTTGLMLALVSPLQAAEDSNAAYSEGFNLVLQQQWQQARDYFTRYATDWPDSDMQDDAGYWRCFAWERSQNVSADQFNCYQDFVNRWEDSNWLDDARERMMIIGRRLAEQGQPEFLRKAFDGMDFDFDFDFDIDVSEIQRMAEEQASKAREMVRTFQINTADQQDKVLALQDGLRTVRLQINRRNVDRELLAVLSALKDDPRASELLIKRFNDSDDPEVRGRIVLMMQDLEGDGVAGFLRDVAQDDEDETVRSNAVVTLLDRNEPGAVDLMRKVMLSDDYSVSTRSSVIRSVGRWDSDNAIPTFQQIIAKGGDPRLVAAASNGLMALRSKEGYDALATAYRGIEDPELSYAVLGTMDGRGATDLLGLLTEVALGPDDKAAAIAIENIADLENAMAVTTLEHIYFNTSSQQRHLAIIHGMGAAGSEPAVKFLVDVLGQTQDLESQVSIIRALGDSEQESAIEPIMGLYRQASNPELKNQAIRALRRLDDFPQAKDYLLEVLEDQLDSATTH